MPSLRQQVLRRKPVMEMTEETGADTGEASSSDRSGCSSSRRSASARRSAPASSSSSRRRCRSRARRSSCRSCSPGSSPASRPSATPSWRAPCRCRVVLLLRLRHPGRGGRDGRRRLPAARVRRVRPRGCGRLVAVPQPAARQSLRLQHPRRALQGAGAGRGVQPARRDPGRRCARCCSSAARASRRRSTRSWCCIKVGVLVLFIAVGVQGFELRQPRPTSPRSASPESPRPPASSSSPTSGWTRSPPPARR